MTEDSSHNHNTNHNSNNNPQAGANRPLPKKEADLFRTVVRHYESKQYKKAIKAADTILKKFPTHGETLAMKGLTLNAVNYHGKRDEAHDLVKRALTYDMKSHVCWHVYGLLHRSDRNYNEAIKAYKQALKIDSQNLQILRDLSNLQIQMRDVDGFVATRNALLTLKPNAKVNWMAFALAKHLAGEHRDAIKVIDIYLGTLTDQSDELGRGFESSELALYRNQILAEIPDNYQEALEHLNLCEPIVVDKSAWLIAKAEHHLALRDYEGAKRTVTWAFDRGHTENFHVHTLYEASVLEWDDMPIVKEALRLKGTQTLATLVPLSDEQRERIRQAYLNDLMPAYPSSYAVQTIPISMLSLSAAAAPSNGSTNATTATAISGALREALEGRCRRGLTKGVPSLCSELASFVYVERKNGRYARPYDPVDYASHPVFQLIVGMAESFVTNLEETESKFATSDPDVQPPETLMWARFLRSGLCELSGDNGRGLALVDKCLESHPTECDLYELKARLLENSGASDQAADCIDHARELDPQDRYMNNLTTRYLLRAGRDGQALRTISLFAKHEGNPEQNLFDMQCSWYELEVAEHFARKQDWGRSLKKFAAVVKHFDDINEDQFDFHGYCLRKVTLRAYVDVLRFEDEAYGQEYYVRAASGIVSVYLHLMDHPLEDDSAEPDYSSMTAAERKKAKAIARKKKKAAEKKEDEEAAAAAAAAAATTAAASQDGPGPDGENSNATSNGTTNHSANSSSKPKGAAAGASTGKPSFVEEDPLGKELLSKDPAEEARKYVSVLIQNAPRHLKSWLLCYDASVRRGKGLLALRALRIAQSLNDDDVSGGQVLWRIVDLATRSDSLVGNLSAPAQVVFREQLDHLLGGLSLDSYVKVAVASATEKNGVSSSLPYLTALAKAAVQAGTSTREEASHWVVAGIGGTEGPRRRGVSVESCRAALSVLKSFHDDDPVCASCVQEFRELCRARYPLVKEWS